MPTIASADKQPVGCNTVPAKKWNQLVNLERQLDGHSAHRTRVHKICVDPYKDFKRHVEQLIKRYCHYPGVRGVKCWIRRAAIKYHQVIEVAMRVADCESDFRPWLVNQQPVGREHAQGLFQFLPSTWATTAYAAYDIFSARWNSMAAMWMWKHGRKGEWACQ